MFRRKPNNASQFFATTINEINSLFQRYYGCDKPSLKSISN